MRMALPISAFSGEMANNPKSDNMHISSNTSSARALSKLGMVQEGLLREFARKGDAFYDVVMMALLRKEWPPAQKLDRPGASTAVEKALS